MKKYDRESTLMIRCPNCGKASDSIKCYRMVSVIFIFIGAQIRAKNEIGCPSCIRQKIIEFMLINILQQIPIKPATKGAN